jgi:hypothetical protein
MVLLCKSSVRRLYLLRSRDGLYFKNAIVVLFNQFGVNGVGVRVKGSESVGVGLGKGPVV